MATGTQVPFTTPGQAPCCCGSECFDATSGAAVPSYATNSSPVPLQDSWFNITDDEYNALKAGGSYAADFSMFLSTFRDSSTSCTVGGVPTGWIKRPCTAEISGAHTNVPLTLTAPVVVGGSPSAEDTNCMRIMESASLAFNEYDYRPAYACGVATEAFGTVNQIIRFSRSLGKVGTQSKLNCSSHNNTNAAAGNGWRQWFFIFESRISCGSFSAPNLYLHSGNIIGTIPTGNTGQPFQLPVPNITAVVQIQINGGTPYTIPNTMVLGYSAFSGIRTQFFTGASITCGGTTCNGGANPSTINYVVKFTGSPP